MSNTKRRSSLDSAQLAFTFDAPAPARYDAALAGLDRLIAACVARALHEDPRNRYEIAGAMSSLLDEEVSKLMLDAYASEAREQHNISAGRFLALIAATDRFDILDAVTCRIGARVLVGEEMRVVRAGHIRAQIKHLQRELKDVEEKAQPIVREARRP